jgi:hypothetical protein
MCFIFSDGGGVKEGRSWTVSSKGYFLFFPPGKVKPMFFCVYYMISGAEEAIGCYKERGIPLPTPDMTKLLGGL